jgi:hypothetical protein
LKKIIAISVGMLSMVGGAVGVAIAAPGPNDNNNHGLCTAYFNGSEQGRSNKRQAGPFVALETAADDGDDDTPAEVDVWNWCMDTTTIGGQPDDPNTDGDDGNGKKSRGKG